MSEQTTEPNEKTAKVAVNSSVLLGFPDSDESLKLCDFCLRSEVDTIKETHELLQMTVFEEEHGLTVCVDCLPDFLSGVPKKGMGNYV